jgi:hypothetical protein
MSVPQTIHDLPSVVGAAEESGQYPEFGQSLVNLEVDDEVFVGDGPKAWSDTLMFGAPMGVGRECSHVGKCVVDTSRRSLHRVFWIVSELLVGLKQMFLNEI